MEPYNRDKHLTWERIQERYNFWDDCDPALTDPYYEEEEGGEDSILVEDGQLLTINH